jgi:uncharacterized protein
MKLLLWALFILLLIWLMRGRKQTVNAPAAARRAEGIEAMAQCAHCGVYVPESEAVLSASRQVFCSEEHRLRHAS